LESLPEKELTLRDLFLIYRRRRRIVYGTLLLFGALAAIYCAFCTRRYEATGTLQVQKESSDSMGLDNLMGAEADSYSDPLDANINLQTQASILQSDTLALRTIEDLHMEGTQDFQRRWNPVGWVLGMFSPAGVPDPAQAKLEDAPRRRRSALVTFSNNLKVKPVSGTRLIEISYRNPDPKLAAAVVNKLAQNLIDYTFQTRYDATNQVSEWLSGQLGELRKNSEDLQEKVVDLQRQSGVYSLGVTDSQGHEQAYSGELDRLQQATLAMTQAEQSRILKGAIAQAASTGDAEMLSGLAGNTVGGNSQAMSNALALIQSLRQQEATQQAAIQEAEAKYGASYPKLVEMRGNVAGLERSIHQEVDRIRGRAKSDYAVAVQTEASTRSQYELAKQAASKLNDKAIEYSIAREEADQSRGLYEDLLKRLKEAGVLAGLKSSNITVVDPGRTPAKPNRPNVPLYMAIALGGGLFLGYCGALLVDTLDSKINGITDLEESLGHKILGALPLIDTAHLQEGLIAINEPQSTYVEALRAIRTAVLLLQSAAPPKVLLVASAISGEGKSTFSSNLAAVLTQHGQRVLLVEADMRRGAFRRRFHLRGEPGLSSLLTGQTEQPAFSHVAEAPNLDVLVSGHSAPDPAELLGSETMRTWIERWRQQYDFVVLDGTPVLPVTDSVILNSFADATLLLARDRMTEKVQVKRSYQTLTSDGKHYVGVVLNGLSQDDSGYYGYYGYRKNSYTYEEGRDADA
jgi:capsular exopolysaccharide synthesis family protein